MKFEATSTAISQVIGLTCYHMFHINSLSQFLACACCTVSTLRGSEDSPSILQIFVPVGYSFGSELFNVDVLHGGSAWGAGTFAGATGARLPSKLELDVAEHQVISFFIHAAIGGTSGHHSQGLEMHSCCGDRPVNHLAGCRRLVCWVLPFQRAHFSFDHLASLN